MELSQYGVCYIYIIHIYKPLFTHSRSSTIIHHRPWSKESRIHPGSLNRQKKHFIYFSSDSEMRSGTLSKIKYSWKGLCWCISRFKMFTISYTNKYNNFIRKNLFLLFTWISAFQYIYMYNIYILCIWSISMHKLLI